MPPDPLDRVRVMCLALPEAAEKAAWGEPTFRAGPKGKMFASYASPTNHHGAGRAALWCPAEPGAQPALIEAAPDRYFVPPYVGVQGWIGLYLDAVSDDELAVVVAQAYRLVAPKRLVRLMSDG